MANTEHGGSMDHRCAVQPSTNGEDEDGEDKWMFDSVQRYRHVCMYKLDAMAITIDVDGDSDRLALGVAREYKMQGKTKMQRTYQLLVLRIPDKISATKSDAERDLSNNRDLQYLAGSDLGPHALRQVKFYDSTTLFAMQDYIFSCWTIGPETDILTRGFSVNFEHDDLTSEFYISYSKLSLYMSFNNFSKTRHYKITREIDEEGVRPPGPIRLTYDDSWTTSDYHFKEGNLAGHDLWFWNIIFGNDRDRPDVFIDGVPTDINTSRQLLKQDWGNPDCPRIGWFYQPRLGLYGATVRLSDKPEIRLLTFRSKRSGRWDCQTAKLGFTMRQSTHPDIFQNPEVRVFPEEDNTENFRVIFAASSGIYCCRVLQDGGIYQFFHHDGHRAPVIRVRPYPANTDVMFSVDADMNVHIWWPFRNTMAPIPRWWRKISKFSIHRQQILAEKRNQTPDSSTESHEKKPKLM